ncbi:hypothetical protein [Azotobacter chroococcum]|uniref:hypothetical protein n=1 Tax=Azotobacter chroococcum TaxID=353 RepID=UPI0010AE39D3|nr:hypothetical protein [Azotobacter chroococcum]TKD40707.1 hypothetical protein FCG41_09255 [Azotobacter chroococcum]
MSKIESASLVEAAAEMVAPAPAVTFIDKAYKVRTLVLPDGRAFAVNHSRIAASDPALIEYLDNHRDFTREA